MRAIKKVFGDYAHKVSISSTKSMTGHMLGGAGAVEMATCSLAIRDSVIPPTINLENPRRGMRPRLQGKRRARKKSARRVK